MSQTIDAIIDSASEPQPSGSPQRRSVAPQSLSKLWPRRRLIVLGFLLGAIVGFLLTSGPVTYQSTATVQLGSSSADSTRVKQVAQTVERTALSSPVIEAAAEELGEDPGDLASRVTARWETDTDVVLISARGSDAGGVADDANAVVDSLREFYNRQTKAAIQELSTQGDELLSTGRLEEQSAEAARRSGVGAALATRQGEAAAGFTTVTPLDAASNATPTGLSRPIAIALGGFVGLVLSAAAAIALPFRRRRIGRADEVAVLLPGTRGIAPGEGGAAELAGLFMESECTDLALIGVGDVDAETLYFASDVTILLRAHGVRATIMDATDTSAAKSLKLDEDPVPKDRRDGRRVGGGRAQVRDRDVATAEVDASDLASYQFLGRAGRREARARHDAQSLLVVTSARNETVSLLAGQSELMTVVAVRAGRSQTARIKRVLDQLRSAHPIVVLLP